MQDVFGQELNNGDAVVYVTRKGSSINMRRGTVEYGSVFDGTLPVRKADGQKGLVKLRRLDHVIKVPHTPPVTAP
jgi:uncharacterized Zn ribbon protein